MSLRQPKPPGCDPWAWIRFFHPTFHEPDDAVRAGHESKIVRHHDDSQAVVAVQVAQELDDVLRRTKLMRSVVSAMMECRCQTLEDCGEIIMRRTECVPRAPR